MRSYALVILDNEDQIIDRYSLDITTNPTGNGFEIELDTISSNIEDIITNVKQKKIPVNFTVQQIGNSYQKSNILARWIQKYLKPEFTMALEYNDGTGSATRLCEGRVTTLEKGEKAFRNVLQQGLVFTKTTPYFIKSDNAITISKSNYGKQYPYKYPYSYGTNEIKNNEINNEYIDDVPVIITLYGKIDNPIIELKDENNVVYNTVKFVSNYTVGENEKLIINSAKRKIYRVTAKNDVIDETDKTDPSFDTFLRAESGLSYINISGDLMDDNFKVIGTWRQYLL